MVGLVPVDDRVGSVAATASALLGVPDVDEVVVVDDGSRHATAEAALDAGARVVVLPVHQGTGVAVGAGMAATPQAGVYVLIDAGLGAGATDAGDVLAPVLAGEADMAVAVRPPAGGLSRRLVARGIERATGGRFRPRAPLSGVCAVDAGLLRSLPLGNRFGMVTALAVDAVRAGARVVEIAVVSGDRHNRGFRHRATQGVQSARALWPRLTTSAQRVGSIVVVFAVLGAAAVWSGGRHEPGSVAPAARPSKVVVFGMPRLGMADLGTGALPTLDRLVRTGAVAATTVRTLSKEATTGEGYAALGAGSRVAADAMAGYAFDADDRVEGGTAAEALVRRSGRPAAGDIAVVGAPVTARLNEGRSVPSPPGALGDALRAAGRTVAVVGNADIPPPALAGRPAVFRPVAAAAMDGAGWVGTGEVGRSLLTDDAAAPFGVRADRAAVRAAVRRSLAEADVVVVDPGDIDRATDTAAVVAPAAAVTARHSALRATDTMLADVVEEAGTDALVLVVSVAPPGEDWRLTPMVASGPGVVRGYLHSPSTRRLGVVTLTDVAPTVLDALGLPAPSGMIGHPLRYHPGTADLEVLRTIDRDDAFRDTYYTPMALCFVVLQALVCALTVWLLRRPGGGSRSAAMLRWAAVAIAAWPLSTFVLRAVPDAAALGAGTVPLLLAIDAAIVIAAGHMGRPRPLGPLAWVCGATVALLVGDLAFGAPLQTSSLLGYSYNSAARFTGLGNTAFAMLAATAVLAVALHVHHAPRRREAIVTAACVLALVALADGAPSLGSDVGGILTLVPVFGLTVLALCGRRLSWRAAGLAAGGALALVVVATGVDLLRPAGSRTHLGALVSRIGEEGAEPVRTTLDRKLASNLRSFRSPWAWVIAVTGAYLAGLLAWGRGWARLLPPGSALRAGLGAVLAAGVLGYAVNDSGAVVAGVAFVYVGPFLTLLALRRDDGPLRILEPAGAGVRAGAGTRSGRRLAAGS